MKQETKYTQGADPYSNDFIEDAVNAYYQQSIKELERNNLGDIERENWEGIKQKCRSFFNPIIGFSASVPTLKAENEALKEQLETGANQYAGAIGKIHHLENYIEYVDGKADINELPLSFDQWKELENQKL